METALDLLTPLYNDIMERLTKEPNQNSDSSDEETESEHENNSSQSDQDGFASAPENQKSGNSEVTKKKKLL